METSQNKEIKPLSYKFNFFLIYFFVLFFVAIVNFKMLKDDMINDESILLGFDTCFKVISALIFILAFNDKKVLDINFINIIEKESELVKSYIMVIISSIILNFLLLFGYAFYKEYTPHGNVVLFLFIYGLTISLISSMFILIYIFLIFGKYMLYKKLENPRDDIDFSKYRKTTLLYILKNVYMNSSDESSELSDIKHLFNSIIDKTNLLSDNDVIDIIESRASTFSEQFGLTDYVPTSKKIDGFTTFLIEHCLRKDYNLNPINFNEGYLFYKVVENIDERFLNKLMSSSPVFTIKMNLNNKSFYLSVQTYYKEIAKRFVSYTNSTNYSHNNNIITDDIFFSFNIHSTVENNTIYYDTNQSLDNIYASLSNLYFSIIKFIIDDEDKDHIESITLKYFEYAHYDPTIMTDIRFSILSKCISFVYEINKEDKQGLDKLDAFKNAFESSIDSYLKKKFNSYKINENDINSIFDTYDNIKKASNAVDHTNFDSKEHAYVTSIYKNHFISKYVEQMFNFFDKEINIRKYPDNLLTHLKNKIKDQQDLHYYYDDNKIKSTINKIDLYLSNFNSTIKKVNDNGLASLHEKILEKFSITNDMISNKVVGEIEACINKTCSNEIEHAKFIKIEDIIYYLDDILVNLYNYLTSCGICLGPNVPYIHEYVAEIVLSKSNNIYKDNIYEFIDNDSFQKYFFTRLNDKIENNINTILDSKITNYKNYNASNVYGLRVFSKYKDMGFMSLQPIISKIVHIGYMDFCMTEDEIVYVTNLAVQSYSKNYNYNDIKIMPNIFSLSNYITNVFKVYKHNTTILKLSLNILSNYFADIRKYINFEEYITLEAILEISVMLEKLKNEEFKAQYKNLKEDVDNCIYSIEKFLKDTGINLNYTLGVLNSNKKKKAD